ncbi:MAG: hypothetical protein RSA70_03395 [Clostridia bacterium]
MALKIFLLVFIILHIILCVIVYLGLRARVFKFSEQLMPIVFCVPIWGVAIALIADYNSRRNKTGCRTIGLDEMHIALSDYRLMKIDEDEGEEKIVPLEEAMSINDTETRRKLMVDILHQNPNEYIRLLQQARLNDDLEVTHYASTAMMEVQREYEIDLQNAEREYKEHPEQEDALQNCIDSLNSYINSGLIDESVLYIHRKRYVDLLATQMREQPDNFDAFLSAANTYLEIGDFGTAKQVVDTLTSRWANNENSWFAKLKYCQQVNDGVTLRAAVSEIKRRNVYLSPEGRQTLSFWDPSYAHEKQLEK